MSYLILNGSIYTNINTDNSNTININNFPTYYILQDYDINSKITNTNGNNIWEMSSITINTTNPITNVEFENFKFKLPVGSKTINTGTITASAGLGELIPPSTGLYNINLTITCNSDGKFSAITDVNGLPTTAVLPENFTATQIGYWDFYEQPNIDWNTITNEILEGTITQEELTTHYRQPNNILSEVENLYNNVKTIEHVSFFFNSIPPEPNSIISEYCNYFTSLGKPPFSEGDCIVTSVGCNYEVKITDANGIEQTIVSSGSTPETKIYGVLRQKTPT